MKNVLGFQYCESLTSIVIPLSVTKILSNGFIGCTKLSSIYIENSNIICQGSFIDAQIAPNAIAYFINLPSGVTEGSLWYGLIARLDANFTLPVITTQVKQTFAPTTSTTLAQTLPTDAPTLPTDAPTLPTDAPTLPTDAPTLPTDAPTLPTDAPTLPTDAPTLPTEVSISTNNALLNAEIDKNNIYSNVLSDNTTTSSFNTTTSSLSKTQYNSNNKIINYIIIIILLLIISYIIFKILKIY
jgi:hypothetical protein